MAIGDETHAEFSFAFHQRFNQPAILDLIIIRQA